MFEHRPIEVEACGWCNGTGVCPKAKILDNGGGINCKMEIDCGHLERKINLFSVTNICKIQGRCPFCRGSGQI